MHNHNNNHHNNSGHNGMMWMMLICCFVPVILLLGGTAFLKSIGYGWIGIGLVAIFLATHFRTMLCSRRKHNPDDKQRDGDQDSASHNRSRD